MDTSKPHNVISLILYYISEVIPSVWYQFLQVLAQVLHLWPACKCMTIIVILSVNECLVTLTSYHLIHTPPGWCRSKAVAMCLDFSVFQINVLVLALLSCKVKWLGMCLGRFQADGSFIQCASSLLSPRDCFFCLQLCVATSAISNKVCLIFPTYVAVCLVASQHVHTTHGLCSLAIEHYV